MRAPSSRKSQAKALSAQSTDRGARDLVELPAVA
jgi:hypothetical protein